ncbi:hypothetical protein BDR26DRAFT_334691 [Obelidium mucronatum]|nr:hypothetical protein BDR26DRAFT_334691 [Obelidium mucronatum]
MWKIENNWRQLDFESRLRRIRALASHHGPVSIRLNTKRKGELQSVLDAWFPNSQSEYGIFILSGTSHLSPNVLEYAQQMSFRYLHGNHQHNQLMGVSLHPVKISELGGVLQNTQWPERSPFLLQFPPAFGMILRPNQWTDFITWFHSLSIDFDPMIYDSEVNLWDSKTRWDKFLARYLVEFGNAFIYPNLPLSLISNSRKAS